jgi:hypothetical protein
MLTKPISLILFQFSFATITAFVDDAFIKMSSSTFIRQAKSDTSMG